MKERTNKIIIMCIVQCVVQKAVHYAPIQLSTSNERFKNNSFSIITSLQIAFIPYTFHYYFLFFCSSSFWSINLDRLFPMKMGNIPVGKNSNTQAQTSIVAWQRTMWVYSTTMDPRVAESDILDTCFELAYSRCPQQRQFLSRHFYLVV